MDDYIRELNKKLGKTVLYIVPAPQAVIALREKIIAGQAPGLKSQEDLFTDALGHGKPPLQALVAYCNFAVIYRRSPVGLPVPAILKQAKLGDQEEKLNRLLQELAWDAVVQHPLSGVSVEAKPCERQRARLRGVSQSFSKVMVPHTFSPSLPWPGLRERGETETDTVPHSKHKQFQRLPPLFLRKTSAIGVEGFLKDESVFVAGVVAQDNLQTGNRCVSVSRAEANQGNVVVNQSRAVPSSPAGSGQSELPGIPSADSGAVLD